MSISVRWVAAIVTIWMLASTIGALMELAWLGSSEQAIINQITTMNVLEVSDISVFGLPVPMPALFIGLWNAATFRFAFVQGDWRMINLILSPITAAFTAGLIAMFLYTTFGFFRRA